MSESEPVGGEAAHERRREVLRRLSRETATLQKTAFGKGPVNVKSYLFDDILLVVMRDGLTVAETTMLDFGRHDLVRSFRQEFENEMTSRFVGMVEEITGRKVLTYQSQIMFDPHTIVGIFIFDQTAGGFVAAEANADDVA